MCRSVFAHARRSNQQTVMSQLPVVVVLAAVISAGYTAIMVNYLKRR